MARVQITKDDVAKVIGGLHALVGKEVLIGIPDSAGNHEGTPIKNSDLGYVHEFGSPANNVPARPFLIPGVSKATPSAVTNLQRAAQFAMDGETRKADQEMYKAGAKAMNAVKEQISSNIPPPLKPATIRNRRRSRGTKSRRTAEDQYKKLLDAGADPASAQSAAGITALINTGQLRDSVTYVLGNKAP